MSVGKHVYFLRPVGQKSPIKIGCSKMPLARLRMIEVWSPVLLEIIAFVPGEHKDESALHQMFSGEFLHGEWFRHSDKLQEIIDFVVSNAALPVLDYSLCPYAKKKSGHATKSAIQRRSDPKVQRSKWRITQKLLKAERRVYGFSGADYMRPDDVEMIYQSYQGFATAMPNDAQIAVLDDYMAYLSKLPDAPTDFLAWKDWHKLRLAA